MSGRCIKTKVIPSLSGGIVSTGFEKDTSPSPCSIPLGIDYTCPLAKEL